MEELMVLRTFGAVTTVLAAALVAANVNARITVAGFMIFIVASLAWMVDGWLGKQGVARHSKRDTTPDQRRRSLALVSEAEKEAKR
jgi:hypothetical protein